MEWVQVIRRRLRGKPRAVKVGQGPKRRASHPQYFLRRNIVGTAKGPAYSATRPPPSAAPSAARPPNSD